MAKFKWNDREFAIVERPTFGEIAWLESQSGKDFQDFSNADQTRALLLLSVRRAQPPVMLTWRDTDEWSPSDFEDLPDDADSGEAPDPTAADPASAPSS